MLGVVDQALVEWLMANSPDDLTSDLGRARPAWHAQAACLDEPTSAFIPEVGGSTAHAKGICQSCPVSPACLRYALDDPDLVGVWGGTTERERRTIRNAAA